MTSSIMEEAIQHIRGAQVLSSGRWHAQAFRTISSFIGVPQSQARLPDQLCWLSEEILAITSFIYLRRRCAG